MKFFLSKKQSYLFLFLGILWIVLGVLSIYIENKSRWFWGAFILFGVFYSGMGMIGIRKSFIDVTDDVLTIWVYRPKKINLKNLTELKYFAGNYIFKSGADKVTVPKNFLTKQSLPKFDEFFKELQSSFTVEV